MAHWLTTHYPHPDGHPWFIYLKDKYRSRGSRFEEGDEIFFFELAGKTRRGQKAIVAIGQVIGQMRENRDHRTPGPEEVNETWEWEIPCGNHDFNGRVPKKELYAELNWPDNKPTQIKSGVMSLAPAVADRLRARFKSRT